MIYSNIDYLKTIIDEGIRQTTLAQLSGARPLEKAFPENLIFNQRKLADEIKSLRLNQRKLADETNIDYLKTIIDEGIRQTRLAQLSGSRHLEKVISENPIHHQIKLAREIESLRRLGIGIPAKSILTQESLRRLGIGIPAKSILTQIPPRVFAPSIVDECDIKERIKHKLRSAKCDYLISTVDVIDSSEIALYLESQGETALIHFLKHITLEINEQVKELGEVQRLFLLKILQAPQKENGFVDFSRININTSDQRKSQTKRRLIERGLLARNPAKGTKEAKLTRLGRYVACALRIGG